MPGIQHQEQDCGPAVPAPVNMTLLACVETTGLAQAPHTILAELLQLDTLYWPVVQVEQLVHTEPAVMPSPVEYVPDWQGVHAPWLVYPSPV